MVRAAMLPTDSMETVKQMLRDNFDRAYTTNRAPYVLTLDADFLTILPDNGGVRALTQFLQEVTAKGRNNSLEKKIFSL